MYQGVIKDDARLAAKRVQRAREAEFSEQARKRAYLEDMQGVSDPATPPVVGMAKVPIPTKEEASQMEFGCTTCEKQV
jgi:protein PET117